MHSHANANSTQAYLHNSRFQHWLWLFNQCIKPYFPTEKFLPSHKKFPFEIFHKKILRVCAILQEGFYSTKGVIVSFGFVGYHNDRMEGEIAPREWYLGHAPSSNTYGSQRLWPPRILQYYEYVKPSLFVTTTSGLVGSKEWTIHCVAISANIGGVRQIFPNIFIRAWFPIFCEWGKEKFLGESRWLCGLIL